MSKVKVLIEGYAKETEKGWLASSTTILIDDSNRKILVDPGINKELLLQKLAENNLPTKDIDVVFMTHYHPDHVFLAPLFENALVLDGDTIYKKDEEISYQGNVPGTSLQVVPTPGHAFEHCSLIVETGKGKIAIAGDLFWWMEAEEQELEDVNSLVNREDPFTKDMEELKNSRRKILKTADWIIPGHGKMFKNKFK